MCHFVCYNQIWCHKPAVFFCFIDHTDINFFPYLFIIHRTVCIRLNKSGLTGFIFRMTNIFFKIKIIRIFNTYGPRMLPNDGRVVSNFIIQALNNEDITIYGDGKQTRSFQYIDDLIEGMVRMMDTEDDFTGPINIGNPNEFPVLELAERVIRMTGSTSKIVFKPLPTDDPKQRQPDIKLAKEKLGWQPTVELEDGLKRMIEYFKNV